jgi:hypothetical protein
MKNITLSILAIASIITVSSCGNKAGDNTNTTDSTAVKTDTVAAANVNAGTEALFVKEDLLGGWMAVEGECYAEEISIDENGVFSSYLHAKPFSEGKWELTGNKLNITLKDGSELKYTMSLNEYKDNLTLTDEAGKISVYEAIVGC